MGYVTGSPEPGMDGARLNQGTIEGRKVITNIQSDIQSTSVTIPASEIRRITVTLKVYRNNIADAENLMTWSDVLAFHYSNQFVDANNDFTKELVEGSAITFAEAYVHLTHKPLLSPSLDATFGIPVTEEHDYRYVNYDSSSHTVYFDSLWKILVVA